MKKARGSENNKHVSPEWSKLLPHVPSVKKYATRKDWEDAVWTTTIEHLAHSMSASEVRKIIETITTPSERRTIILRLAALYRLSRGTSYKEIGGELWVSPQMISTIVKAARTRGYRSYYDRGKTDRRPFIKYHGAERARRARERGWTRKTKYGTTHIKGF